MDEVGQLHKSDDKDVTKTLAELCMLADSNNDGVLNLEVRLSLITETQEFTCLFIEVRWSDAKGNNLYFILKKQAGNGHRRRLLRHRHRQKWNRERISNFILSDKRAARSDVEFGNPANDRRNDGCYQER